MPRPSSQSDTEVLIAGAGPTGLVLAIWLTKLGVRVRIVDKLAAPETTSRAIGVQARTLEYYRQFNFADTLVAHGRPAPATNLSVDGRVAARLAFHEMGSKTTPFPFALIISQDIHERLLVEYLNSLGVQVERPTELTRFEETGDGIRATLQHSDGASEVCEAAWLAACDGARSGIREALGIDFSGGTYALRFYVADVQASGPALNGEIHVALDANDFIAIFPLPGEGCARLIGTVRADAANAENGATWADVNRSVIQTLRMKVDRVNWFSVYRVHHRIAAHFRHGRVFLAGDAAHIHTPVGGQGLNTGVGDAVNLAWKLAAVLRARAATPILDTYEPERVTFARKLVDTTDRVFTGVTSPKPFDRWVRLHLAPFLLPLLLKLPSVGQFIFTKISQVSVQYRSSNLSQGRAGRIHGGDRLPWIKPGLNETSDNFTPLKSMDWQVHVYGVVAANLQSLCTARNLPLHVFPWRPETKHAGFQRNAAYLIRPDGHVAMALGQTEADTLSAYLDARKILARA